MLYDTIYCRKMSLFLLEIISFQILDVYILI